MTPQNENPLKQLVLRTMLLESESGQKLVRAARRIKKTGYRKEDREQFASDVRKTIKDHVRELMADEPINTFIDVLFKSV